MRTRGRAVSKPEVARPTMINVRRRRARTRPPRWGGDNQRARVEETLGGGGVNNRLHQQSHLTFGRSANHMICLPTGWRGWAVPRPSTTTCGESTHVWLRRRPPRSQRICLLVVGSGRVGAFWCPGGLFLALSRPLGRAGAAQSHTSVPEPRVFASPEAGGARLQRCQDGASVGPAGLQPQVREQVLVAHLAGLVTAVARRPIAGGVVVDAVQLKHISRAETLGLGELADDLRVLRRDEPQRFARLQRVPQGVVARAARRRAGRPQGCGRRAQSSGYRVEGVELGPRAWPSAAKWSLQMSRPSPCAWLRQP